MANPFSQGTPVGSPEGQTPTEPRLIAGRYKTVEEAERGLLESAKEAQRLLSVAKSAEDRARTAELALEALNPHRRPDPLEDATSRFEQGQASAQDLRMLVEQAVSGAVKTELAPIIQAARAQASLDQTLLPDAQKLLVAEPSINDKYQRILTVDPEAAADYLGSQVRLRRSEAGMHQSDANARNILAQQRTDAGIVQGGGSVGNSLGVDENVQARQERMDKIIEYGRNSGDMRTVAREALRGIQVWRPGSPTIDTI